MLFEQLENKLTTLVEIRYPRSINDFIETFQKILIPNFQDGMYLDFEIKIRTLIEKKVPVFGVPDEFIPILQKISEYKKKQKKKYKKG